MSLSGSCPSQLSSNVLSEEWFRILEFPTERNGRHREPPLVYTDSLTGTLYPQKPAEIAAHQ